MDTEARAAVLKRSAFFHGLNAAIVDKIAAAALERLLKPNETLFQQGDPSTHHYIVAWGRLRLDQTTPDGKNIVLRFMGPGDLVGSVAVFRSIPYPATPTAVEETRVFQWTSDRMNELMSEYPVLAAKAMAMMGGRIGELQERLQQISTQQVERRIAAAILRIVAQSGRKTDVGVEIPFPLSRQDLAEMTGTTLHTVSRTLSAWIDEGVLEGKRSSHLVVLKPHRLMQIAEQA
ncbi:MAG: cyclic nucleotide-binding domain-containing protein [Alphaproteobacteria bacterium]|nr:cyclic nucleotide-binding domain-containing protein [Alphaproteobacteria bacterium]